MMITGTASFECPIDHRKVTLDQDCVNCKHLRHYGLKGAKPYISCEPDLTEKF